MLAEAEYGRSRGFPLALKGKSGQLLKPKVRGVHDRMPVILPRERWADWLDGPPDDAKLLCQPYPADMVVRRTDEVWVRR